MQIDIRFDSLPDWAGYAGKPRLREKYEEENNQHGLAMLKKISPVAWRHIHFQGHFIFTDEGKTIDLDKIINNFVLK